MINVFLIIVLVGWCLCRFKAYKCFTMKRLVDYFRNKTAKAEALYEEYKESPKIFSVAYGISYFIALLLDLSVVYFVIEGIFTL